MVIKQNVLEKIYQPKDEPQISISTEAKVVDDSKLVTQEDVTNILQADICPECPEAMVYEEGCQKCYSCGYSKC